jgi:phosphoglycerate dehydrogenase-like enzyme
MVRGLGAYKMRYGVVGYGVVGNHMADDVRSVGGVVVIYDKFLPRWDARDQQMSDEEWKSMTYSSG